MNYPTKIVLIGCSLLLAALGANGQQNEYNDQIYIRSLQQENTIYLLAKNETFFTVSMSYRIKGQNYKLFDGLPDYIVLSPGSNRKIRLAQIAQKDKKLSIRTNYTWFLGNIYARPDEDYVYRLPFPAGKRYRVGQSYNGSFSHNTGSSRYAVDFEMPVGSPVLAARGGIVVRTTDHFDKGGANKRYLEQSNYIMIEHSDGTFGEYAHIKKSGVYVKPGDRVQKGQLIGLSGNTGFSSGPHLHFAVTKVVAGGRFTSIPFRFNTSQGILKELKEGERYGLPSEH